MLQNVKSSISELHVADGRVAQLLLLQDRIFSLCYTLHIHDITKILAKVL